MTILSVLAHLVAATAAAWISWPHWLALVVTMLSLVVIGTEQPRWRAHTTTRVPNLIAPSRNKHDVDGTPKLVAFGA